MSIWFNAAKRPTRPGVYPVRVPNLSLEAWARWTGEYWTCWAPSAKQAALCQWRGIRIGYDWRIG
jgi:hypothetical protein